MSRTTLRELNGFDAAPATLTGSTLILIDLQNTYTRGVMELDGWQASLDAAAQLLERAREAGTKVVHVINDGGEGTPYDIRAEIGRIHPAVAPADGETVVVKQVPNAFHGTDLGEHVPEGQDVIIAGWMTHMCVAFTAQGAFLRGNRPTVVADACATRSLPLNGNPNGIPARQLHESALATVQDLYGMVVSTQKSLK
ncbi:cysteine hydrolase family protein [Streptomyces sp. ATCC51928]|uniref:Cysteine hydrolase family protein n=1 Tax=Streptomyces caviscabies TaxID=90079 RepID=A0ABW2MPF6_9ACTN|nr:MULTISPECIES: cysteine hydrolase family protein [unclassified Streptomyces]MDX3506268.1 cysteine hydrolase family protein [Streptomyces sp. ATCC51928]MDX5525663.1 cysteine hydrolase family protein [Streptomyces sp. DE06-01C]